jgi:hypothetical protein
MITCRPLFRRNRVAGQRLATAAVRVWLGRVCGALVGGLVAATPGFAQVAVTSRTTVEHVASAGETYRDAIGIHNTTDVVQVVRLAIADYTFDASGTSRFAAPPSHARSNAAWILLSQNEVSIAPGADVSVAYSVAVPAREPQPSGTYWSVVLIEPQHRAQVPSARAALAVVPVLRQAVQMATHIGATGEARLTFSAPVVNGQQLAIDVTDAGSRACRPSLRLEVYTSDGSLVTAQTSQRGLLYPTTSLRQKFELPPLAPGEYTVLLLADVGVDHVQGQKFQIVIR